nr:hypothetical protein [uncultured Hyphomonas sp.]
MIPVHVFPQLERTANQAIAQALNTHLPMFVRKAASEPDFVAAFVLYAVPRIAQDWASVLQKFGVSLNVAGVFCHQSPMVHFDPAGRTWPPPTKPVRCELADLLIVHDHYVGDNFQWRRAVLVQAKKTPGKAVSSPDPVQYHLYNQLPPFEILPARFAKGPRYFANIAADPLAWQGMQYGLIRDAPRRPVTWHMYAPAQPLVCFAHCQLAGFMTDMLDPGGIAGRAAMPGGSGDWDRTIDELLTITAHRRFRLKSLLGSRRAPAGSLHLATLRADGRLTEFAFEEDSFRIADGSEDEAQSKAGGASPESVGGLIAEFGGLFDGDRPPPEGGLDDPGPGAGTSTLYMETRSEG